MEKKICESCSKEFEYDMKPGYPRKYCPVCSAQKKASYENRGNSAYTESEKIETPENQANCITKPSRETSIVAQCLTKCVADYMKMNPQHDMREVAKSIHTTYNFFLKSL